MLSTRDEHRAYVGCGAPGISWQPLVVPCVTTFADDRALGHPVFLAVLQWAIVTAAFGLLCGRLRAWQQLLAAIATMALVGVLSHVAICLLGFHFFFDAP